MIEEQATVTQLEDGFAWVETQRQSACGSCAANKGCGTASLDRLLGRRTARLRALNQAGARAGDRVVIGLREGALVQGSFAVYMVPLLALGAGAILGDTLAGQLGAGAGDAYAALFGGLGFLLGGLWLRGFSRRVARDPRYQPVILRVEPTVRRGIPVPVALTEADRSLQPHR